MMPVSARFVNNGRLRLWMSSSSPSSGAGWSRTGLPAGRTAEASSSRSDSLRVGTNGALEG